jgi:hypothetical protein
MLAKLALSALTVADAKRLRFSPYTAAAATELSLPVDRAGFKLPYFDLTGKTTSFYRYRYLESADPKGFGALVETEAKDTLRYAQPAGSLNEVYLPPYLDWTETARDPKRALVITEGELKAACAAKHGIPTAGLGGVWNFRAAVAGYAFLPSLEAIR